jgi:hypothetical protein
VTGAQIRAALAKVRQPGSAIRHYMASVNGNLSPLKGTIHAQAILKWPTPWHPISHHEMLEQVQEILRKIQIN